MYSFIDSSNEPRSMITGLEGRDWFYESNPDWLLIDLDDILSIFLNTFVNPLINDI